jgi:hypothetical protein
LASPIKISKILTDNGSQFTGRFTTKDKKPSGKHVFDTDCAALDEVRAKHTGTVKLNFLIGADGAIRKAEIGTSPDYPALDQAA